MPDAPQIWSVTEVNSIVRDLLEGSLLPLWVTGEVGNLTLHRSGHVYMTLKDRDSQIRAVFFNGLAQCRKMDLREGCQVEAFGKLSVYAARGEYQLNLKSIQPCGLGDLQLKFEELKRKLAAEGIFDPARKKPIPFLPARIGVVSSPSGAALKDFLKISLGRFPGLHIKVYPAPVQGKGAELKLAGGIRFFNRTKDVDVIVLTRGGGSLEDLWPFNEEILARAISDSRIPVVSAVGHEIDFTISDFAADFRAPTPSGAAEAIIPDRQAVQANIDSLKQRMLAGIALASERAQGRLDRVRSSRALKESSYLLMERMQTVDLLLKDAEKALLKQLDTAGFRLKNAETGLASLNPYNVLKRGYAFLTDPDTGHCITKIADAPPGKHLNATVSDGMIHLVSAPEDFFQGHP